jgi:hypothetical protein
VSIRRTAEDAAPVAALLGRTAEVTAEVAEWQIVRSTTTPYAAREMCGPPANMSIGYLDPGYIHTALLTFPHTAVAGKGMVELVYSVGTVVGFEQNVCSRLRLVPTHERACV